jgi:hypothetical protein
MGVGAIKISNYTSHHHHRWVPMPINLCGKCRSTMIVWKQISGMCVISFDMDACIIIGSFMINGGQENEGYMQESFCCNDVNTSSARNLTV